MCRLTAHAHRCVKLKQRHLGLLNNVRKVIQAKSKHAPSLVFLCVLNGIALSVEQKSCYKCNLQDSGAKR